MSEAALVVLIGQIIAGAALNLSVLLPILLSTRRHAKTSAYQTKNNHESNLRDDVDVLIVAHHRMHEALGIEDTYVRERFERIQERKRATP